MRFKMPIRELFAKLVKTAGLLVVFGCVAFAILTVLSRAIGVDIAHLRPLMQATAACLLSIVLLLVVAFTVSLVCEVWSQ